MEGVAEYSYERERRKYTFGKQRFGRRSKVTRCGGEYGIVVAIGSAVMLLNSTADLKSQVVTRANLYVHTGYAH